MSLTAAQIETLNKLKENNNYPIPVAFKNSVFFMLSVIEFAPSLITEADPVLTNSKSFIISAVKTNCDTYRFVNFNLNPSDGLNESLPNWQDNEEITRLALQADSNLIYCASERLKSDEDLKWSLKTTSRFPSIKLNKILKNNFFEGLIDTFDIMYGNYVYWDKIEGGEAHYNYFKYGVVDLTMIPLISHYMLEYGMPIKSLDGDPFRYTADNQRMNNQFILRIICASIGVVLQGVRLALALGATALVSPLVALIHVLKFPYVYYQQHQLFQLKGDILDKHENCVQSKTNLGQFVARTHSNLNNLKGQKDSDITSYSTENTDTETYGRLYSITPKLFFRPSPSNNPSQTVAREVVTKLGINEAFSYGP